MAVAATDRLVILLHGVGSNGRDMAGLGDLWQTGLPACAFVAPDAPENFDGGGNGFQWSFAMKKIDLSTIQSVGGSTYPPPFDRDCADQTSQRIGRVMGLTHFGVNLTVIEPGAWSSQRHWHSHEDEFIWVVEGELTLITDGGEEILRAGDCAAFKAGDPDGHHLVNKSRRPAKVLEIGNTDPKDRCVYSDIDMVAEPGSTHYSHRDGSAY